MEMEKRVRLILLEEFLVPLLVPDVPGFEVDGLRRRSPPGGLSVPSAIGNTHFSLFMGVTLPLALSFLVWSSDASISYNSSTSAIIMSPFQILPAYNT